MSDLATIAKRPVYLSASRIETYHTCSALYYAKYLYKVPDPVGEAARRGSVAHDTLEILLKPRHAKVFENAILHDTCTEVPALWRVVERFARKYEVYDEKSLGMIDEFIMIALKNDFRGPKGTYKVMPELEFNLQIDRGDGRKFNLRGFIDQMFFVRDVTGEWLDIKDFKTGAMFRADKIEYNVQAMMYLLVARHLYPQFKRRRFRFQFVGKGKNAWVQYDASEDQLDGFEWMLSELQTAMDSFTADNALDNLYPAVAQGKTCWLYGKPCGMKDPVSFYALVAPDGGTVATAFKKSELKIEKPGQTIESRRYMGCPAFYDPKTGLRRNLNQS